MGKEYIEEYTISFNHLIKNKEYIEYKIFDV
jgi:hypothetical protein